MSELRTSLRALAKKAKGGSGSRGLVAIAEIYKGGPQRHAERISGLAIGDRV